ncbi:hypothetical protein AAEO56_10640 [Flavobacterium sp. DGU11]|uniref:Lipoprotein n=1 Tax=Flavobacterium arundinis TaxID=3139143 RepID=A0ABU9HY63_9FLAO
MKNIILAFLPFLLIACASKKGPAAFTEGKCRIESRCPDEGNCGFEVLKDKSLIIKSDGTGKPYYTLEDAPGKIVARYTYAAKSGKYQDDAYTEEVIFETDSELSNLHKSNPKDAKMLFGVHCFCRDKAGFYKVGKGLLDYQDNKLIIKLQDNIVEGQKTDLVMVSFK